jgi:hypothetical protein
VCWQSSLALLAVTIVAIGEVAGHTAFPPPPGLTIDPHDPASMKEVMEKIPQAAKLVVVLAWGAATLAGSWFATWVAARFSRPSVGHGVTAGIIILSASLATLVAIPHPVWMWVSGLSAVLGGTYIEAIPLGRRSQRAIT